jgi:predicted DsbA family dithiol-disulfide isomerase
MKSLYLILLSNVFISSACVQNSKDSTRTKNNIKDTTINKMKIEIWSDIACPFCYIGKHKLDKALANFTNANQIEIVWKSYQLDPNLKTDTSLSIYQSLSVSKGISLTYAKQMTEGVTNMGAHNGIVFNFDKTIPANTLKAHQFVHFAAEYGKQSEAKEKLFEAYFINGLNVDDNQTLSLIASQLNLDTSKLNDALFNQTYLKAVQADIDAAKRMNISGVPYFVFDRKYAISGAQDDAVFANTLQKAFDEWLLNNPSKEIDISNGPVCTPAECK